MQSVIAGSYYFIVNQVPFVVPMTKFAIRDVGEAPSTSQSQNILLGGAED